MHCFAVHLYFLLCTVLLLCSDLLCPALSCSVLLVACAPFWTPLLRTALLCTALSCSVLLFPPVHLSALHCYATPYSALHSTASALYSLFFSALHFSAVLCTSLLYTALLCYTLHCTAADCPMDFMRKIVTWKLARSDFACKLSCATRSRRLHAPDCHVETRGDFSTHCTALHCSGSALHRTALHCSALHRIALYCTALHCSVGLVHLELQTSISLCHFAHPKRRPLECSNYPYKVHSNGLFMHFSSPGFKKSAPDHAEVPAGPQNAPKKRLKAYIGLLLKRDDFSAQIPSQVHASIKFVSPLHILSTPKHLSNLLNTPSFAISTHSPTISLSRKIKFLESKNLDDLS
jgi:hypothetical protein